MLLSKHYLSEQSSTIDRAIKRIRLSQLSICITDWSPVIHNISVQLVNQMAGAAGHKWCAKPVSVKFLRAACPQDASTVNAGDQLATVAKRRRRNAVRVRGGGGPPGNLGFRRV